jgi:serine/threonine protein kinase
MAMSGEGRRSCREPFWLSVLAVTPGTRLGPYEVTVQISVDGMGEAYQATDTKLKREVAVEVLPAALGADPERLARFQREAEVLTSLNNPNIAQTNR